MSIWTTSRPLRSPTRTCTFLAAFLACAGCETGASDAVGGESGDGGGSSCPSDAPDADNDGEPDCNDACPEDPDKTVPGDCGCGVGEDECESPTCPETSQRPVKVFLLAGQSNMVGAGTVAPNANHLERNGGMGTLEYLVDSAPDEFGRLTTNNGDWVERDDVWLVNLDRSGPLSVGFGADGNHIGPEFQFGHLMGDRYEELVVIIKTSWGGKSLQVDFRPPSSGGDVGPYYLEMVARVRDVLANLQAHVPGYAGQGYELVGIGWHQGWNDRVNQAANDEYQANCVNLINDLRDELGTADLPFVLATTGMSGWDETHPRALSLMEAQLAVPTDERLRAGNVRAVETRDFWRSSEVSPADQGFHWNRNAETYYLIGDGLARSMDELLAPACVSPSI